MRTFTQSELSAMTVAKLEALSPEDQAAYWRQIEAQWAEADAAFVDGDYDRVGANRRFELGE